MRTIEHNHSVERRLKRQIAMLLNTEDNTGSNDESLSDLFDISQKIVLKKVDDIDNNHKNDLINSLALSKNVFEEKISLLNAVKSLEKNNQTSFLIVPIHSFRHLFAALIRRLEDGSYICVLHDKSDRENEYHKSYVFKDLDKLVKSIHKNYYSRKSIWANLNQVFVSSGFSGGAVFYTSKKNLKNHFHKESATSKTNQISTKGQKVGNCFFKEVEYCIKDAIATRIDSFDDIETKFYGDKHAHKIPTETFHKLYIRELLHKYKNEISHEFEVTIDNDFDLHIRNKRFRKLFFKSGVYRHLDDPSDSKLSRYNNLSNILNQAFEKGSFIENAKCINSENLKLLSNKFIYNGQINILIDEFEKNNIFLYDKNFKDFPVVRKEKAQQSLDILSEKINSINNTFIYLLPLELGLVAIDPATGYSAFTGSLLGALAMYVPVLGTLYSADKLDKELSQRYMKDLFSDYTMCFGIKNPSIKENLKSEIKVDSKSLLKPIDLENINMTIRKRELSAKIY